jgi:hypothetical protein
MKNYPPNITEADIDAQFGDEPVEVSEEIAIERIVENLTSEQEEILQAKFMEEKEIGGIPITKDNCEYLFENWLGSLSLLTLEEYLK